MRQAFFSLIPMLAAAILVMVGVNRVARENVEMRIAIDRDRVFEFDSMFRDELDRLDELYANHLENTAVQAGASIAELRRWKLPNVPGLLELHLFSAPKKAQVITIPGLDTKLPELVIRDTKQPLNPNFAVALDPELFKELPEIRWLETPAPGIRIYLASPSPGVLAAFFIDIGKVRQSTDQHLADWLQVVLSPLEESGQRTTVISPSGHAVATTGPHKQGPAALSLPVHTDIGVWRTDGWDGVVVETRYDIRTLIASGVVSLLLTLAGLFIYTQQRRAIKLAAERVSFVNRVSHELGTPLTNIALNLDLARDHLPNPPAAAKQRLDHVNEEIQRLSRLVANVLTFSRKERNAIEIRSQPCVADVVIAETLESFRPALARREIEIECQFDAGQTTLVDSDTLAQITGNLISNVEKYAACGKWLRIQTRMDEERLIVEVHDRGPGIPENSRKRVFRAFERVHRGTNEGSSGTGLGLTIAKELAGRMGGTLELMDVGEGCAFRLSVPAPSLQKSR